MKTIEYLQNLPVGEVVNKKALSLFKRLGFVWDYSKFGYLEGLRIRGAKPEGSMWADEMCLEVSSKANCKAAEKFEGAMYEKWRQSTAKCELTRDQMWDIFGVRDEFEYKGMTFRTKYLDGCFSPYLIKSGPGPEQVNRRMSLFGNVI